TLRSGTGRRRALLRLPDEHDAEADHRLALVRRQGVAVGGPAGDGLGAPAAAPEDAEAPSGRPGRIVARRDAVIVAVEPVGAPLPDVAVHVEKPEVVGGERADPRRARDGRTAGRVPVRVVTVEAGLGTGQGWPGVERRLAARPG